MQLMYYTEEFHNENAFHLYIVEEVLKISMRMTPNRVWFKKFYTGLEIAY